MSYINIIVISKHIINVILYFVSYLQFLIKFASVYVYVAVISNQLIPIMRKIILSRSNYF
jgi:hypothetical protein